MRKLGRGLCAALCVLALCSSCRCDAAHAGFGPPRRSEKPRVPLGVNVNAVSYFSNAVPFVDVMKMADSFESTNARHVPGGKNPWNTGVADKIPHDAQGYPLEIPREVAGQEAPQVVRTAVIIPTHAERYALLYDGEGDFDFPPGMVSVTARTPGRMELLVTPQGAGPLFVVITRSLRGNHLRNLRLVPLRFEATYASDPFDPDFMAKLRGVGTLRFMDFAHTIDSPVAHWQERTTADVFQGTSRGAALEFMVDLANRLGADPWFCVPHLADDHYIEQMARLIKTRLHPKLKLYIEYSNEVWNRSFEEARWASEQGCRVGLNQLGEYTGDCTEDGVRLWAGVKWNARRSGQIFKIFARVFGDGPRVVRVIAGQAHFSHLNKILLESLHDNEINTARTQADALAVAPYFGGDVVPELVAEGAAGRVTVPQLLDRLQRTVEPNVRQSSEVNREIATVHGLRLIAYEGGQHLLALGPAGEDQALVEKVAAANRDPRMEKLYSQALDAWYAASGNDLMVLYSFMVAPNKYGAWGLLETPDQAPEAAPKYRAMRARLQNLQPAP